MKELYNQLSALGVNSLDYAIEIYKIIKKAYEKGLNDGRNKIYIMPDDIPQKYGKWIYNSHYGGYYECSVCGKGSGSKHKECPNCRAKMESEG